MNFRLLENIHKRNASLINEKIYKDVIFNYGSIQLLNYLHFSNNLLFAIIQYSFSCVR